MAFREPVDPKPAPHFDGQPIEQAGPSADVYALKLKVPRGVWACATSAPSATATTTSCTQVTRPAGYVEDVLPVGRPWHFGRGLMVDEVVVVVPDGTKIGDVLK